MIHCAIMADGQFDDYLARCGLQRAFTAEVIRDSEADFQLSHCWLNYMSDKSHLEIKGLTRLEQAISNDPVLPNPKESAHLRNLEKSLFPNDPLPQSVHPYNANDYKENYNITDHVINEDEGIPRNSADLYANYVRNCKHKPYEPNCKMEEYNEYSFSVISPKTVNGFPISPAGHITIKSRVDELLDHEKFRGNLFAASKRYHLKFIAYHDRLLVNTDYLNDEGSFDFAIDMKEDELSSEQIYRAVNFDSPNHINTISIKEIEVQPGVYEEMLLIGLDNSYLVIFEVQRIMNCSKGEKWKEEDNFASTHRMSILHRYKFQRPDNENGTIIPYLKLLIGSSIWSFDYSHNLLVIGSNLQHLVVVSLSAAKVAISKNLGHNIPSVAIKDPETISAITFEGFQYLFKIDKGFELVMIDKSIFLSDGWSCDFMPRESFLPVPSWEIFNEADTESNTASCMNNALLQKNKALGDAGSLAASLGLAGLFEIQRFHLNTSQLRSDVDYDDIVNLSSQMWRRSIIHKLSKEANSEGFRVSPYVLISGCASDIAVSHMAPYIASFFYTKGVFLDESYVNGRFRVNARVNFVIPIPQMQCIIFGSNGGQIDFMRCLQYRGVFSLTKIKSLLFYDQIIGMDIWSRDGYGYTLGVYTKNSDDEPSSSKLYKFSFALPEEESQADFKCM